VHRYKYLENIKKNQNGSAICDEQIKNVEGQKCDP
jgi:hypothetical protein